MTCSEFSTKGNQWQFCFAEKWVNSKDQVIKAGCGDEADGVILHNSCRCWSPRSLPGLPGKAALGSDHRVRPWLDLSLIREAGYNRPYGRMPMWSWGVCGIFAKSAVEI